MQGQLKGKNQFFLKIFPRWRQKFDAREEKTRSPFAETEAAKSRPNHLVSVRQTARAHRDFFGEHVPRCVE